MTKFIAKISPKQMVTYKGRMYKASNGFLITDDKDFINQLSANRFWEKIESKETKKDDIDKPEPEKENDSEQLLKSNKANKATKK